MQLQTILNRVEGYKSFVDGKVTWDEQADRPTLRVEMKARANGRPICSGCDRVRPGYDRLPERTWEFVPLWQITVLFVYALRRVECPKCGVVAERVPWGDGKCQQTKTYRWFLARWAKRLSWKEVAEVFHTKWDTVFRAVQFAVSWGIVHRQVTDVVAIGVDEIQWKRGHHYLTLVYQVDARVRRLLWVGQARTEATLEGFFDLLGADIVPTLQYVCSDMWRPYLNVIRERAGEAVHVLDRYHIMSNMKLKELLKYNLRSVRAYLLKEDFQRFWEYRSPAWAQKFLRECCQRAMRSRLEPMKKVGVFRRIRGQNNR